MDPPGAFAGVIDIFDVLLRTERRAERSKRNAREILTRPGAKRKEVKINCKSLREGWTFWSKKCALQELKLYSEKVVYSSSLVARWRGGQCRKAAEQEACNDVSWRNECESFTDVLDVALGAPEASSDVSG